MRYSLQSGLDPLSATHGSRSKANMKKLFSRKAVIMIAVLVVLGAWGTGIVMANTTNVVACGTPTGFSALVHKAFFAPSASCSTNKDGTCKNSAACTATTATGLPLGNGKCTNVAGQCQCVLSTQTQTDGKS